MGKKLVNQVQEAQIVPDRINPRGSTPRSTVIKLAKIKDGDKIVKATREKRQITYMGTSTRLSTYFSTETLQTIRERHGIFKMMKGKN